MKLLLIALLIFVVSQGQQCKVTSSDVLGPYYIPNAPRKNATICSNSQAEDRLFVQGTLWDADSKTKLVNAKIELWQANLQVVYSDAKEMWCRSTLFTDAQGKYKFLTWMPG